MTSSHPPPVIFHQRAGETHSLSRQDAKQTHAPGPTPKRKGDNTMTLFLTDYLGEEMKPWQNAESGETAASA